MKSKFIFRKEESPQQPTRRTNSRLFNSAWLMVVLLSLTMWQCKNDDYKETTGICPEVVSTVPADKAINVVATRPITVTFNETMNASTISTSSFLVTQGTNPVTGMKQAAVAVAGVVTPASGESATFTFTPESPLTPFTLYTGTMKKGVKDPMNNMLQEDYVWSFTTQPLATLSSNPVLGGTTSGGGLYNEGTAVIATVVPNPGYVFANWTENGTVVSTNANYAFDLEGNRTLVANFTAQYNIAVSSLPLLGGTSSGNGTFNANSSVTVTAVPSVGYTFTNWTEGTTMVSALKEYTFPATASRVLVANFGINMYLLTVNSANGTVAKLPNQTTFGHGTSVQLTATPNAGYTFTSWSGDVTGTSNTATVIMNSERNVTANFTANVPTFNVGLSSNPLLSGTTTGGGTFDSGESVTVRAVPAVGFTFTNWTEGTNNVSSNANYTFNIAGNRTLTANFAPVTAQFTVSTSSLPLLGGTATGEGSFDSGESVTVRAVAAVGYTFANWTEGTTNVSSNANYTFNIAGNRTLTANFAPIVAGQFLVDISANPLFGGSTNGEGMYDAGETVSLSATANANYTFTNWTEGANIISTNANYTFTINGNRIFVANFESDVIIPIGPAAINLGSAGDFTVATKSGISTTGVSSIGGNIGVSPAAATFITGFGLIMDTNGESSHTPIVTGKVYASDYAAPTPAKMTTAISDMETAFTTANNLVTPAPIVGLYSGDISGRTLPAGLYKWSTGVLITNAGVTLEGGPNDVWVFQIAQDLTVNNSAIITLKGGAQAKNIFWIVSGQALLGSNTDFSGIILSKTLISLNTGARVTGRLLAQTAVTLNASTVVEP